MAVADVVVLGGGLIGCAIARELARGGLQVALFERGRIGDEASRAAAGMLGVQGETEDELMLRLAIESRRLYPDALEALRAETGVAVEFWREGTLYLCVTPGDEAALGARCAWQCAAGDPPQALSAKEVWSIEPAVSRAVRSGVLFTADARLDNAALTDAYARAARAAGCTVHDGTAVDAVAVERGRVVGVVAGGERVACGAVVNAAGAWAAQVRVPGATPLPVEPVRGQMVVVRAERPPFRHAVYSPRGYAVARRDGRVLLGSTREAVGFDKRVTAGGVACILAAALELSPGLGLLPVVQTWAGLRPGTPDGRPIIGADPSLAGYYLATGHYRNGVLLAPLTAVLVAALLRGERGSWADALRPERFARGDQTAR